jgi:hypothetical protein
VTYYRPAGDHEVIREGLTSPWIPDGWGWGGVVSTQCAIWAELYINPNRQAIIAKTPHSGSDDTEDEDFVDAPEQKML